MNSNLAQNTSDVSAKLNDTTVTVYPDNIERWLRRPDSAAERTAVDQAITGNVIPCLCQRCVEDRFVDRVLNANAPARGRFETWLESLDPRAFIATLDKLSNIALIVLVISFVAFVLGQLTMWLMKGGH